MFAILFFWRPFVVAPLLCLGMLCSLVLTAAPVYAQSPDPYLGELQAQAQTRQLARDPVWRTLLHYKVHPITRRDRSLADDSDFFNAPHGATDPEAELLATLAAFFDDRQNRALNQQASCRFIARFQWLNNQLHFDPAKLPPPRCDRYQQWRNGLNADSATLVFPAAYLNSPASMYGHTFLRLDPKGLGQQRSPLLSYAINYAADGNESEGLAFAFKGLTGLYAGQFTNAPYYLRIRDYNDLENRDIWEYELALTPDEMDRLLAHAWELGPTRFDYFFFDENCSYHLLALIDAARPGLNLTDQFTWKAIPIDTVRAVVQVPGLLKRVNYRPANSTELKHRADRLSRDHITVAKQLATGQMRATDLAARVAGPSDQALILEVAERYLAFDATQRAMGADQVNDLRRQLLGARAALPAVSLPAVPVPSVGPHEGHRTARTDVLIGQRNGLATLQLQTRGAYHDLTDVEAGFQRGSAIQFFRLEVSQTEGQGLQLEKLTPVDIVSLSPDDGLISAGSWRVKFGLSRPWRDARAGDHHEESERPLRIDINGGPGWSRELAGTPTALFYLFMDTQIWLDTGLSMPQSAFGSGVAMGLVWDVSAQWRLLPEVFAHRYIANRPWDRGLKLDSRFQLSKDLNWVVHCQWKQSRAREMERECLTGLQRYW